MLPILGYQQLPSAPPVPVSDKPKHLNSARTSKNSIKNYFATISTPDSTPSSALSSNNTDVLLQEGSLTPRHAATSVGDIFISSRESIHILNAQILNPSQASADCDPNTEANVSSGGDLQSVGGCVEEDSCVESVETTCVFMRGYHNFEY